MRIFIILLFFWTVYPNILNGKDRIQKTRWFKDYEKRFAIEMDNQGSQQLKDHPVILQLKEIQNKFGDFNSSNFVLIEALSNEAGRIVASQIDDTDGDGVPDELVFVCTLPASSKSTLFCYYSPGLSANIDYPGKTDTNMDWTSFARMIGWESNWCGYSFYDGKMDFYAKRVEGLQMKQFGKETNYHKLNDWGMDVLIIGDKPGLGGITIWDDEKPITTIRKSREDKIQYEFKILSSGPVRSLVQIDMKNIYSEKKKYSLTMWLSAFTDNRFSKQDIRINSENEDSIVYSPGIQKLANDECFLDTGQGCFSSWGIMDEQIKEIGLGLIFNREEFTGYQDNQEGRYVKLKIPEGVKCTYYTIGAWKAGYNVPALTNGVEWNESLLKLGNQLKTPVVVKFSENKNKL